MFLDELRRNCLRIFVAIGLWSVAGMSLAEEPSLVAGGQARAAIVVGRDAGQFHRWVAGELQRYIKQLSGAELPIVAERQPAGR